MKKLHLSLMFIIICSLVTTSSHALGKRRIRKEKEEATKGWVFINNNIKEARTVFTELLERAKDPSKELAEKIKELATKRDKKLAELKTKRVENKYTWAKYTHERREILEKYEKDMEDFDSLTEKATKPILQHKFRRQVKRVLLSSLMDRDAEAKAQLSELEKLLIGLNNDVEDAIGEWEGDERPNGNDLEAKLELMSGQLIAGIKENFKPVPQAKIEELKAIQAAHKAELDALKAKKNKLDVLGIDKSIKKWKLNKKYAKKYDEVGGPEMEGVHILVNWIEKTGELWMQWGRNKKSKFNNLLSECKNLVKAAHKQI